MTFKVGVTYILKKVNPSLSCQQLTLTVCVALVVCKLSGLGRLCAEIYIFGGMYMVYNLHTVPSKPLTECNAGHIMQAVMKYLISPTQEVL